MKIWLQCALTIYSLGILPFLVGMMWTRKEKPLGFAKTYVMGYVSIWTIFYVIAVPMIVKREFLSNLTQVWEGILIVVPLLWAMQFVIRRKAYINQLKQYWKNIDGIKRQLRFVVVFAVLFLVVSIGFIIPSVEDDVPETVAITLWTDTMYEQQPYTMLSYGEPELKFYAPIDMFYSVNADITEIEAPIFVHIVLPVFLLGFFFASAWEVGGYFFGEKLEDRGLFTVFSMILYTVSMCSNRTYFIGVFQNIWNGATMLCCCMLPLVVIFGFRLLDTVERKEKPDIQVIIMGILTIVSAQLMLTKGALLSMMSLMCCVGIYIIRKGWERLDAIRKH